MTWIQAVPTRWDDWSIICVTFAALQTLTRPLKPPGVRRQNHTGRSVGRSAFIERPSDGRGPCWLHCVLLDDSCEQPPRAVSMDERCDMNWCDVQSKPWPQSTARRRRIERFVRRRRQKPTKYQRFVPIYLCQLCRKSIMQLYYICVDLWINVCMDGRVISTRSTSYCMCLEGGAEGTVFQYILSYFHWPIAIKFSGKKLSLGEQTRTFKFKLLAQTCPVTSPWFTRIQMDALGHTLAPFWSVLSCHLCFLPGDSHPWQVLVNGAPPVCTRTTWTPLEPLNLPVQRLSRYTLVIHS